MNTNRLLSEFQFYDKYSRFNHELGRRETWEEAVQRSVDYLRELSESKLPEEDYQTIRDYMLDMKAFPSMRLFAMAGEAARRDNASIYNCAAINIDSIESMVEVMALSMAGCGVGFSVEKKHISKLPVSSPRRISALNFLDFDSVVSIDDSTEGWLSAFKIGLDSWFDGKRVLYDYSKIRPAGSILKIKGGRASGPEPLKDLLETAEKIILGASGRQLTSLEVHDIITKIADCVVSGGVRRSALISLFDLDDELLLHAKDYGWWNTAPQRANANNSIIIDRRLEKEEIADLFMTMHKSGGGEPGFMFRANVNDMNPTRRKDRDDWLYNPCQPGFATVLTPNGIRTFDDIEIGSVIWGGNGWTTVTDKWSTGTKPVYIYKSTFGEFIGTESHKVIENGEKVEVCQAEKIQASAGGLHGFNGELDPIDIMDGLVIGDGSVHKASNNLVHLFIGTKDRDYFDSEISDLLLKDRTVGFATGDGVLAYEIETTIQPHELPNTYSRFVPDRFVMGDEKKIRGFLRGLFSANGSALANGKRVSLKQTSRTLISQVQIMLSAIGIRSYITTNKSKDIEWNNGTYRSKKSYDLNISIDRMIFMEKIGFIQKYKNENVVPNEARIATDRESCGIITSIDYLGDIPVYDITVDNDNHVYWTGGLLASNCGEVNLRGNGQMCNLSQAIIRCDDNLRTLADKVKVATIIGTIQSMATSFPYLRQTWKENCEEERLLGVDLPGQLDHPSLVTEENLDFLREYAIRVNREYAERLGIQPSAAITCNKPSGNSSILFDCSPGLHSRWSDYYIRRFRVNAKSPIRYILEYSGVRLFPENRQEYDTATSMVVEFPVKSPDGAITNGSRSAIEQCNWWKLNKLHWTEHNPSVTILYKEHEIEDIVDWMYENQSIIGGMAFLPKDDHYYPLAPYEKITKEQYEEMVKDVPVIDWEYLLPFFEKEDNTTVAQELACMSGTCEI